MALLTLQQKQVLSLRFGLEDGRGLTQAKIAALLGLSRQRVRQIEKEALGRLHQQREAFQDYLVAG
jgi:RNA polymerase nonessential primary-like sigma factor